MSLTTLEIIQVMTQAKELGFTNLKIDGLELNSTSKQPVAEPVKATEPPPADLKPEEIVSPLSVLDELTDEEILYWSTPYYQELQEKKEAMKQAKALQE